MKPQMAAVLGGATKKLQKYWLLLGWNGIFVSPVVVKQQQADGAGCYAHISHIKNTGVQAFKIEYHKIGNVAVKCNAVDDVAYAAAED